MAIAINTKELETLLEVTPSWQNIMLAGRHGIGKSQILTNYFEARGMRVVALFLGQMSDPGDLLGLPNKDEATGKTTFMPPYWFPVDGQPIVLFLDELNRARPEILQVVMDLTLSRKLAGKSLPAGSQVISAINEGDEYQLTDLDPALVSRFNVYNFVPTPQDWIMWATRSGIDSRVVSFISTNVKYLDSSFAEDANTLDKSPDRRAWERISDIMKCEPTIDVTFKKMISGIVGGAAAVAFYESLLKNILVTPEDLLSNFNKVSSLLANYNLQQYTYLNDSICSYIDSSLGDFGTDSVREDTYAENLQKYFEFLVDKKRGNKEALAHFINNYETGSFPNVNFLVASHTDLEDFISNFITSTGNISK